MVAIPDLRRSESRLCRCDSQPVVDASRPFEVGEDLVDPTAGRGERRSSRRHGHCGDRRGPQRSRTSRRFSRWRRDRRSADEVSEVSVSFREFMAPDEHLAAWLRPCPVFGPEWRRPRPTCAHSTMLARSLWASRALRSDTERFWAAGRDAVGVGRPGLVAALAGCFRPHSRCVLFRHQSRDFSGRIIPNMCCGVGWLRKSRSPAPHGAGRGRRASKAQPAARCSFRTARKSSCR